MKRIIVTGDVTADWNVARIQKGPGSGQVWNDQDLTRACLQPGGAAMLGQLIHEMFKGREQDYAVDAVRLPEDLASPVDSRTYHSYVMWKAVEYPENSKQQIWRVESFLGLDSFCGGDSPIHCSIPVDTEPPTEADIVVIDDAGLNFRTNASSWPKAITAAKPEWIIIKMSHPVGDTHPEGLWRYLLEHHAERTIVVTSISDLRKCSVRVSKGLSWERTAQDLIWEFVHNPIVSSFKRCAHVVVSLGLEGAFLLSNKNGVSTADLLYDPLNLEGEWSFKETGRMLGYNVCLTAALAREIAESLTGQVPQISKGVRHGMGIMRSLFRTGYGPVYKPKSSTMCSPAFPFQALAALGDEFSDHFCWRRVPDPVLHIPDEDQEQPVKKTEWRILNDVCRDIELDFFQTHHTVYYRTAKHQELINLAVRIVQNGYKKALKEVPILNYGKLVTADRDEIEDMRRIAISFVNYCESSLKRPLCLAVFGAPGSGKSFGIKQIANAVLPGRIQNLVFNITQFTQMKDLTDALHQVRDIGLSGKIPLVFWDEFDAQGCSWLKSFLAPMQDGEFQDGQITYHIGRAIFVFAGGTSPSYQLFGKSMDRDNPEGQFRQLKGPDFLSRLHDFLNVKGPNPAEGADPEEDMFIIRRALLLLSLFKQHGAHFFRGDMLRIDPDVLRALLQISEYKHGARSMEAIITMSLNRGQSMLSKSSLPPLAQLNIHVDGDEFMSLTEGQVFRRNEVETDMLDVLAAGLHQVYCSGGEIWKTELAKKSFEELDEGFREENRRHVQDILAKLEHIGCAVVRTDGSIPGDKMTEEEIELLSQMEHMRWMKSKINLGWIYSPQRNDELKHHPCLLPWKELSEEEIARLDPEFAAAIGRSALSELEKDKDRVLVRAIPDILAMAGYAIKRLDIAVKLDK